MALVGTFACVLTSLPLLPSLPRGELETKNAVPLGHHLQLAAGAHCLLNKCWNRCGATDETAGRTPLRTPHLAMALPPNTHVHLLPSGPQTQAWVGLACSLHNGLAQGGWKVAHPVVACPVVMDTALPPAVRMLLEDLAR